MLNSILAKKLDDLIYDKFNVIYDYDFDGIILLCSGAIRNTIIGRRVRDLDFVILTQEKCQIKEFIKKYRLKYRLNAAGGYKIFFNNFKIDIFSTDDLMCAGIYDMDMLFYDINRHDFISIGFDNVMKNRTITLIHNEKNPLYGNKTRLKKMINFIKIVTNSNKRVKVKQNYILWEFKLLRHKIIYNWNKLMHGNLTKSLRFLKNCKKQFGLIIMVGLLMSLTSLLFPLLSGKLITELLTENYNKMILLCILVFLLKIINIGLQFIFVRLGLTINKRMIFNIRHDIINCVLDYEMSDFSNNNRGIFIDKLKSDPNEITRTFNAIRNILIKGVGNVGALLYVFYLDYRIGIILFIFILIIIRIKIIGIIKRRAYRARYYINQEECSGILGEMINGVSDIKNLDMKDSYIKRVVNSFHEMGNNEYNGNYYQKVYDRIANLIEVLASAIVLILGIYLVKNKLLDVSSLVVIYMYISVIFTVVEKIVALINLQSDLDVSCDRIFSLLDSNIYTNAEFGDKYHDKCLGKIEFDNVKFKYNFKNDYVLNNCSFVIEPNETVAIVGKSGEGKTTILNLITRLYSADNGSIKIDDVSIEEYNEDFIRNNISVISQNPYLFDMSIKDNLKLVDENISDKEIEDVCKLVCMDDFIQTLPDKYNTIIGEGGIKLSGGQKQRLGIARALLKNTKIILLDEITSALDNETGTIIKKVISNIHKDHTIIIVTHELSMIKDCKRILVLNDGKIVCDGTHKQLLKSEDIYNKLYKLK